MVVMLGLAFGPQPSANAGPVAYLDANRSVSTQVKVDVGQGFDSMDDTQSDSDDQAFPGEGSFVHTASASAHAAADGSSLDGFGTATMDSLFDSSIMRFSGDLETHASPDMSGNAQYLAFNGTATADASAHFSLAQTEPVLFSYNFSTDVDPLFGDNGKLTLTRDSDGQMVSIQPGSFMLDPGAYKLSFSAFAGNTGSSAQFDPIQTHYDVALQFGDTNAIPLPAGGWTGLILLTLVGAGFGLRSMRQRGSRSLA